MQLTPTLTFRGVERTAALEAEVIARLRKLERYYPGIMGCRVLVELVQRHHEAGNRHHVRIDLTVPARESAPEFLLPVCKPAGGRAVGHRCTLAEETPEEFQAAIPKRRTLHLSDPLVGATLVA